MRIPILTMMAVLAVAAPASASQFLELQPDGRLVARESPYLPPREGPEAAGYAEAPRLPPASKVRAARGPTVKSAVAAARRSGAISAKTAKGYYRAYNRARSTRSHLGGQRRKELSAVLSVLEGIAKRRQLIPSRMPALFLQLSRNRAFWGSRSAPYAGARITFKGSPMVLQYYAGQGLQIQPLANFGMVNGKITHCRRHPGTCDRKGIRQLLDDMVAIRSKRSGFTTWEYFFHFGGGKPPWTSGISSGAALDGLARASAKSILDDRSYLKVAHAALGVFQKGPPGGVRMRTKHGSHYLIYSFDRHQWVLNAFLESIIGLFDYAKVAKDKTARALWVAGDHEARAELPRYDTGRWSRYSLGGPLATVEYHKLATDFLAKLCSHLAGPYCTYHKRFKSYLSRGHP
jgi:D-glucuronyl C5-epimerase C-terminus